MMTEKSRWKVRLKQMSLIGAALVFSAGFDLTRHSVPLDEILSGGPPKDGIPALLEPKFLSAKKAGEQIGDKDRVLGLALNGQAKAYPINILNWHEIVNDTVGGRPVVVTFCPLCGTGMVFDGMINDRKRTFGVSGLLYQSDMLLYDHKTESLWSQIKGEAVAGPQTGVKLKLISSTQTTWGHWMEKHPETLVLSQNTGYNRNYRRDPYTGYYTSNRLMFDVKNVSRKYHPKERVIGIEIGSMVKAYPFKELAKAKQPIMDTLGGNPIQIRFDKESETAQIVDANGKILPSVVGFWFAWYTFHPDTAVFQEKN